MPDWLGYFSQEIAAGLWVALQLLVVSSFTTAVWALVVLVVRISPLRPVQLAGVAYIEFFRGTPLVVQVLAIFAYLPSIGIVLPPFTTAVLAVTLNVGSYLAESFRAGLQSIPAGPREAALALGMSRFTVFRRVIAPVSLRVIVPAMGNIVMQILLTTPFVYLVGLQEMMAKGALIQMRTADFSVYLLIIAIYIVLGLAISGASAWVERRMQLP